MRLIDSCITQFKAQGPSRTCNESKEEEEEDAAVPGGGHVTTLTRCHTFDAQHQPMPHQSMHNLTGEDSLNRLWGWLDRLNRVWVGPVDLREDGLARPEVLLISG